MNKYLYKLNTDGSVNGFSINAKILMFALVVLTLLLPTTGKTDGLFDFQMKLAERGNVEAQYKVGEMYETGFGVDADMVESKKWIMKAAKQGNETAAFKLLYWDIKDNGITDENTAGLQDLKDKARKSNPQAQYYVGKMHAYGIGLKKDLNKGISWLNKAAFVGVLQAERELVQVRESKQRQALAKRRANEKKKAELKIKQEREAQAKLETEQKLRAQKIAEDEARSAEVARQNRETAEAKSKASQRAAQKARLIAKQKAEAKMREGQKKSLLSQRAANDKKRKTQFESDPCSGKSARFLSTCR